MNRNERRFAAKQARKTPGKASVALTALFATAVEHQEAGRLAAAEAVCLQLLAIDPGHIASLQLAAAIAHQTGRNAVAIEWLGKAIARNGKIPELHANLAVLLRDEGRIDDAIRCCEQALALRPKSPETQYNLGNLFLEEHRLEEAVAAFAQAIALAPGHAAAHNNRGNALHLLGPPEEAGAAYRQALALKPGLAEAHYNLANLLAEERQLEPAIVAYRQALAFRPDYPEAVAQLAYHKALGCDWRDFESETALVLAAMRRHAHKVPPFILLAQATTPADQLLAARQWVSGMAAGGPRFAPRRRAPPRKLRLGYFSADFREHPVARLVAELIERHDRETLEVAAYSIGPDDGGEMRQRLQRAFDRFTDLRPLGDAAAARQIHADGIDILIDLTGHTTHARTRILASRPAPVQVNFLGYPATLGAEFIDYIIVDPFVVPPDQQPHFAERLAHLPDCYLPNSAQAIAEGAPSRAECGLPEDGFVFCCFNSSYKITPAIFDLWLRLLKATPGSVLWLLDANPLAKANLLREAAARQVAPERLVFAPRLPLPEHLARHRQADLFLDTLPYNAHTTTVDALWAGLPVLTCSGETLAARVAGSLLRAADLPELITTSLEEYEALALQLGAAPQRLRGLRERLAASRETAPLFDTARFARNLEALYAQMWEIWCAGEAPRPIQIAAS